MKLRMSDEECGEEGVGEEPAGFGHGEGGGGEGQEAAVDKFLCAGEH